MSCRDVRRVVSDYCLFGEQDGLTAPHLEHLSTCRACREAAGVDRALARELRRALAARVEREAPSARVWQAVLRRAQEEPVAAGWRAWLRLGQQAPFPTTPLMARVRTASVLSTMALAVLMVNGQNGMPELPAVPASPAAWNQFERQVALPAAVEAAPEVRGPLEHHSAPADEVEAPPPGPSERVLPAEPGATADTKERLPTAPLGPAIHHLAPVVETPEDELGAADEDGTRPRLIWQLYPALDPASDGSPVGGADSGLPPLRGLPGEPY